MKAGISWDRVVEHSGLDSNGSVEFRHVVSSSIDDGKVVWRPVSGGGPGLGMPVFPEA